MRQYKSLSEKKFLKESLIDVVNRVKWKSESLKSFCFQILQQFGQKPTKNVKFWVQTCRMIDSQNLLDRDALYFAKYWICSYVYPNFDFSESQSFNEKDLMDLPWIDDKLRDKYLWWENEWCQDVMDTGEWSEDALDDDDWRKQVCEYPFEKKTQEYPPAVMIDAKWSQPGEVVVSFFGDPYNVTYPIKKIFSNFGLQLNYNLINNQFNKINPNQMINFLGKDR